MYLTRVVADDGNPELRGRSHAPANVCFLIRWVFLMPSRPYDWSTMWHMGAEADRPEWRVVDTTFRFNLYDAVQTVEGPYAVGGRGTVVTNRGSGWEVVFDDGPTTRQNQLRAIDVTDDGERVWMAGSAGALACYDVEQRRKYDYSYPKEMTSTWEGVAVSGERGREKALVANGNGELLPLTVDGFDVDWGHLEKPADNGENVAALAATPDGVGFAVDASGNAFKTTPTEGWTDIGVVNAQVAFYDIYAGREERVYIAAGDGHIYRYDDPYHRWTPIDVAEDGALRSFDVYDDGDGRKQMTVLGDDGTIYRRVAEDRWEELPSPTSSRLYGLSLGAVDVAIGQDGTILERRRGERTGPGAAVVDTEFDSRERYDRRIETE